MKLIFDHGTLVLTEAPDLSRKAILDCFGTRVELHRAPAYRYAEVVQALRLLRLPLTDEVERPGAAPADEWRSVELRPYQQAAVLSWQLAEKRGLVVLPTGSGKPESRRRLWR